MHEGAKIDALTKAFVVAFFTFLALKMLEVGLFIFEQCTGKLRALYYVALGIVVRFSMLSIATGTFAALDLCDSNARLSSNRCK